MKKTRNFSNCTIFLFLSVHLLQFLEYSIAEFTLWPTYILELLLLKDRSPENMIKIAAFFSATESLFQ